MQIVSGKSSNSFDFLTLEKMIKAHKDFYEEVGFL